VSWTSDLPVLREQGFFREKKVIRRVSATPGPVEVSSGGAFPAREVMLPPCTALPGGPSPGSSALGCCGAVAAASSLSLGSCEMGLLLADLNLAQGQDTVYPRVFCSAPASSKLTLTVPFFFFWLFWAFTLNFPLCVVALVPQSLGLACRAVCRVPVASPEPSAASPGILARRVPGTSTGSSPRLPTLTPRPQLCRGGLGVGEAVPLGLVGMFPLPRSYPRTRSAACPCVSPAAPTACRALPSAAAGYPAAGCSSLALRRASFPRGWP